MMGASTQALVSWKRAENARGQVELKLLFSVLSHRGELQLQTARSVPAGFLSHLTTALPLFSLQVGQDEACNASARPVRGAELQPLSRHRSSLPAGVQRLS